MRLSIRIGLIIGVISIVISSLFAFASYFYVLEKSSAQSQILVRQIMQSSVNTASISAYLSDHELANQIVSGMVTNNLVRGAQIQIKLDDIAIMAGDGLTQTGNFTINLLNPFDPSEIVGVLTVAPDFVFIEQHASTTSLTTAYLLLILSVLIACLVSLFIHRNLTRPVNAISDECASIDVQQPERMKQIDIDYKREDELGALIDAQNELITALKLKFRSEQELREVNERLQQQFRLVFEEATAGIGLLTLDGEIKLANSAFEQLFGQACFGQNFTMYFEEPDIVCEKLNHLINDHASTQLDTDLMRDVDGQRIYLHCLFSKINDTNDVFDSLSSNRRKRAQMIEVVVYDVTRRRELEYKTKYEAEHDSLTTLLNRRAGSSQLNQLLVECNKQKCEFVLFVIDLDKFKPINDNYGHDVGDSVLARISQRLKLIGKNQRAVCVRWGGDEFILGMMYPKELSLEALAELLISQVSLPIKITQNVVVSVGASVGITVVDTSEYKLNKLDTIIAQADALMYKTKQENQRFSIQNYETEIS